MLYIRILESLWPEGLSQGLHQLASVTSCTLTYAATNGRISSEEQRNEAIRKALVQHVLHTKRITSDTLKWLLIARRASASDPIARHQPEARWTLREAHQINHVGNHILYKEDLTQETVDWFVRDILQDTHSQVATCQLCHDGQSTFPTNSIDERLVSPVIRDEFVRRVLVEARITDSIMDWLHRAVSATARERAPAIERLDSSGSDIDESDTLSEESSEDDDPFLEQPDLSCDNDTTNPNKENVLP
ncbi:hypothetical protein HD806DRAFT_532255 [Xylariaceae sp. AK1471]|nr:hypothetical protein HD806DRAFT_532255 [Xylariaceae sp. AK1471]